MELLSIMVVTTVTSPKGVEESENNATVTDTHTQVIPGEMNEEAGDTVVSDIHI